MKKFNAIFIIVILFSEKSFSDFDYQFLRIACIPETGFLDISHQFIHNTAIDLPIKNVYQSFEKSGFYSPHKLDIKCKFSGSEYRIVTTQPEIYSGMCGATPEITLSLYRNNKLMIEKIVFGYSCFNNPSIDHIYIQDSNLEYPPSEMQVCFNNNNSDENLKKETCEWYFDKYKEDYEKIFPLNSSGLKKYFN